MIGLPDSAAATAMSLYFAAMVLGRMIGARLARSWNVYRLLLSAIGLALVGFPIFWLAPASAISIAGLFIAGFGIANFYPVTISLATGLAADTPDLATARLAIAASGAVLVAPLGVGVISDFIGMRWGFGAVLVLLVCVLVAVFSARRFDQRDETVATA